MHCASVVLFNLEFTDAGVGVKGGVALGKGLKSNTTITKLRLGCAFGECETFIHALNIPLLFQITKIWEMRVQMQLLKHCSATQH